MEYRRKNRVLAWQYHPGAEVPHWITDKVGSLAGLNITAGHWFTLENGVISRWEPSVFETVFEPIS